MVEPRVGQYWVHKERGIELCIEALLPESGGVRARWKNTTGFLAFASLHKNYRYDRIEPKTILNPFGYIYSAMSTAIIEKLEAMDDAELITTFIATEELDQQCWWAVWLARGEVQHEARRILNYHREPYQVVHCSKMTSHVPHIWTRPRPPVPLEGMVDNSAGRYYCRGRRIAEGGHRPPSVRVNLPVGYPAAASSPW